MENKKKLQVKDLMTVGIFATIYIVVKVIVGFVGVLPILCVILPMITAIVCGTIYMLFVTKVEKVWYDNDSCYGSWRSYDDCRIWLALSGGFFHLRFACRPYL